MVQVQRFIAGVCGQCVRDEVARRNEGRAVAVFGLKRLVGGAPAHRLHRLRLQPGIDLGVELQQRGAVLKLCHRGGDGGRADRELGAAREDHQPVGRGTADDEVPVAAVVLHQLRMGDGAGFDVGGQAAGLQQGVDGRTVGLVEEVGAAPLQRQPPGGVAAVDDQQ